MSNLKNSKSTIEARPEYNGLLYWDIKQKTKASGAVDLYVILHKQNLTCKLVIADFSPIEQIDAFFALANELLASGWQLEQLEQLAQEVQL